MAPAALSRAAGAAPAVVVAPRSRQSGDHADGQARPGHGAQSETSTLLKPWRRLTFHGPPAAFVQVGLDVCPVFGAADSGDWEPSMNVRGLISSLGAGGSLIAAALCAAALVGGIIAFRGDAGGIAEADAGDVTVPDATATARGPAPAPGRRRAPRSAPGAAGRAARGRASAAASGRRDGSAAPRPSPAGRARRRRRAAGARRPRRRPRPATPARAPPRRRSGARSRRPATPSRPSSRRCRRRLSRPSTRSATPSRTSRARSTRRSRRCCRSAGERQPRWVGRWVSVDGGEGPGSERPSCPVVVLRPLSRTLAPIRRESVATPPSAVDVRRPADAARYSASCSGFSSRSRMRPRNSAASAP